MSFQHFLHRLEAGNHTLFLFCVQVFQRMPFDAGSPYSFNDLFGRVQCDTLIHSSKILTIHQGSPRGVSSVGKPLVPAAGEIKKLGCLQHAHIRNPGRLYMLQFISVDSGHFTQPDLSPYRSDLHEIKSVSFVILCSV